MAFVPEPRLAQAQVGVERIDEGLRSYMLQVYNYMGLGLAITGAVAFLVAATICFFAGLRYLPLAEASAITFLAPIIIVVLSRPVLGERPTRRSPPG